MPAFAAVLRRLSPRARWSLPISHERSSSSRPDQAPPSRDGLAYTLTFAREARRGDEPYLVSGWIEPASPTETGGCIVP